MKTYLDILKESNLDFEKFPDNKFPFISFDLVKDEYFHDEKEITYTKLAATDIGKQSKIQDGLIYSNNSFFLNEVIKTPLVCTSNGIILDFMKKDTIDDDYIFISYNLFDVKLVKSHYSDNPSLLLTGIDMLLSGANSDLGIQVEKDEMKFIYKKLKYYLELWRNDSNIKRLIEVSGECIGDIKTKPLSKIDDLRSNTNLSSGLEINERKEEIKEESPVNEPVAEEVKDERKRILEERLSQLKQKEEDSIAPQQEEDEKNNSEVPSSGKSKPIWKIIQEEFLALKTENIERKKLKEHILQIHPHIKQGTLNAQIALQVINKRARTGYIQCNKERICGEDKLDFLFENENGCLCKYNKDIHGIWEIYTREDGKLDVKLTK